MVAIGPLGGTVAVRPTAELSQAREVGCDIWPGHSAQSHEASAQTGATSQVLGPRPEIAGSGDVESAA
jgi:hypothetical protein